MSLFSIQSKLFQFLTTLWDMVKLNFVWLIFSLPLFTIGASTLAAYTVTMKMVENREGDVLQQFIEVFRKSLKQGIPLGILSIIGFYIVYINLELFNKIESNPIIFLFLAIVGGYVVLIHLCYAFPLLSRYENNLFKTLRNSAGISMQYFGRTLVLWITVILLITLFLFNPTLMFFGILIGPASIFLTVSGFAHYLFKRVESSS